MSRSKLSVYRSKYGKLWRKTSENWPHGIFWGSGLQPHNAEGVRHGQPHRRKHGGRLFLNVLVDSGTDNGICGHDLILQVCELHCSSRDTKTHPLRFGRMSENICFPHGRQSVANDSLDRAKAARETVSDRSDGRKLCLRRFPTTKWRLVTRLACSTPCGGDSRLPRRAGCPLSTQCE